MKAQKPLYEIGYSGFRNNDAQAERAISRVENAIAWLCSDAADNIGLSLLEKAYTKRGKPLTIIVNDREDFFYQNQFEVNRMHCDPMYIDSPFMKFAGPDGTLHSPSLEELIGHELTHAGEDEKVMQAYQQAVKKFNRLASDRYETLQAKPSQKEHRRYAKNTPYAGIASQHIHAIANAELALTYDILERKLAHADYEAIIAMENPAIETQNKICRLRGDPQRAWKYNADFLHSEIRAADREELLERLARKNKMQDKVGIPPLSADSVYQGKSNSKRTGFSKWQPDPQQHPLIADYQQGGRS